MLRRQLPVTVVVRVEGGLQRDGYRLGRRHHCRRLLDLHAVRSDSFAQILEGALAFVQGAGFYPAKFAKAAIEMACALGDAEPMDEGDGDRQDRIVGTLVRLARPA